MGTDSLKLFKNILKEYEAGISAVDLARKHGIGESTIYAWNSKCAGMEVIDLKKIRQLEEENNRLKRMYASLSMDHELLKEVLENLKMKPKKRLKKLKIFILS